jgi:hypothetical protein
MIQSDQHAASLGTPICEMHQAAQEQRRYYARHIYHEGRDTQAVSLPALDQSCTQHRKGKRAKEMGNRSYWILYRQKRRRVDMGILSGD